MREKLKEALNEISNKHIAEAADTGKKHSVILRITAVAAMAAIVIGLFLLPKSATVKAITQPAAPRISFQPNQVNTAAAQLTDFFINGSDQFLSASTNANAIWSPANAYIGLAMLAEITAGESRKQILELLDVQSTDTLRGQVSAVWEAIYKDDGKEICTLANSLWLEDGLSYDQSIMDALGYHYYASVCQGDLGSSQVNSAIGTWLDNNTGGLLDAADKINLSPDTILALYSTLYFQAKWSNPFPSGKSTTKIFHAPSGDKDATYMNKNLAQTNYYWGDRFSAVALGLQNGSIMWFILPDEGVSTAQLLADGQYMQMILAQNYTDKKYMKVNLSVPKFDISASLDLKAGLQELGVTDVFEPLASNFSAITADQSLYLTSANQAARVQIDEEGVKAAAYTEFPAPGSPQPPEEIIDFILDRPFLFAISKANIPLFAGIVNEP